MLGALSDFQAGDVQRSSWCGLCLVLIAQVRAPSFCTVPFCVWAFVWREGGEVKWGLAGDDSAAPGAGPVDLRGIQKDAFGGLWCGLTG